MREPNMHRDDECPTPVLWILVAVICIPLAAAAVAVILK